MRPDPMSVEPSRNTDAHHKYDAFFGILIALIGCGTSIITLHLLLNRGVSDAVALSGTAISGIGMILLLALLLTYQIK